MTTPAVTFRDLQTADAAELSRLALRSKAHWGYSAEFMQACRDELTMSPQAIDSGAITGEAALQGERIVGFYTLEDLSDGEIELSGMFVDPGLIGRGVGRRLMDRARTRARQAGASVMRIQSDPHALGFYQAAGGVVYGELPSDSIPGRMLPMLRIELRESRDAG